jgi:hypothetical protein
MTREIWPHSRRGQEIGLERGYYIPAEAISRSYWERVLALTPLGQAVVDINRGSLETGQRLRWGQQAVILRSAAANTPDLLAGLKNNLEGSYGSERDLTHLLAQVNPDRAREGLAIMRTYSLALKAVGAVLEAHQTNGVADSGTNDHE